MLWPGETVCPEDIPLTANPAPEMLRLVMLALAVPELVRVAGNVVPFPIVVFPKFKLKGVITRDAVPLDVVEVEPVEVPVDPVVEPELVGVTDGGAVTVSMAALLVTRPATLDIVTVNFAPLSAVVTAGVV
jgi:hypothetical protein